jgi:hypothetical protein
MPLPSRRIGSHGPIGIAHHLPGRRRAGRFDAAAGRAGGPIPFDRTGGVARSGAGSEREPDGGAGRRPKPAAPG